MLSIGIGIGIPFDTFAGGGAPVIDNALLLANGTDFLLLADGSSYLLLSGN